MITNGFGASFWSDKKFLELHSGDDCITEYVKKLNCILKNDEFYVMWIIS